MKRSLIRYVLSHTTLLILGLVVTGLAALSPNYARAQALEGETYVGAGLGQSSYSWRNHPLGGTDMCRSGGALTLLACEDSPTAYKVVAGHAFKSYFGMELSYYNAGSASLLWTDGVSPSLRQRVVLNGFALSAVGILPMGPVHLSGRVGLAAANVARKDEQTGITLFASRTVTQPTIGVGIGATVWRSMAVRLDWDRVRGETAFNEKFEADLYTLNLIYRFE